MRYLTVEEVLELHTRILHQSGGSSGLRDRGALESAVMQPQGTFEGEDLYPMLTEKAAALSYALVSNHPFVDGNKRVGHAAMEVFLLLNGREIKATVDEQEELFFDLAAGKVTRTELKEWIENHLTEI